MNQNTNLLNDILNSVGASVMRCRVFPDRHWQYDYISEGCQKVFGYSPEAFVNNPLLWQSQVDPDNREQTLQRFFETVFTADTTLLEYGFYHPDGRLRWISETVTSRWDESQQAWLVTIISQNVSDRYPLPPASVLLQVRLQDILDSPIVAICSFRMFADYSFQYDYFSQGCEAIFGYTAAELMADPQLWLSRVDPEDLENSVRPAWQLVLTGKTAYKQYRFRHKNGGQRWLAGALSARQDEAAQCWVVTVLDTDITHHKAIEFALRRSQQQYQFLINSTNGIVWEAEPKTLRFLFVNQQAEQILGYPLAEWFEPEFWLTHLHPDDRLWVSDYCSQKTAQLEDHDFEYRMIAADGRIVWLHGSVKVIVQDARPVKLVGVMLDISDRKQAEAALIQQQQLTEQIAESSSALIYIYDLAAQRNVYVNRQIEVILGYTAAEIQAMGDQLFNQIIHPEDLPIVIANLQRCFEMQENEIVETQYRVQTKQGTYRWLLSRDKVHCRDAEGRPQQMLGVALDITQSKQIEIERQKIETQLQQQVQQQTLISEIAQRIRQSLSLAEILNTTVEEVRHFLQADRVVMCQFGDHWSCTIIAESVGQGWRSLLNLKIVDRCFIEQLQRSDQQRVIKAISDVFAAASDPCYKQLMENLQIRAKLLVPLLHDQVLWGMLVVHQCDAPRSWRPWEDKFLSQLATQISIAIQQARTYQKIQQDLAERQAVMMELRLSQQRFSGILEVANDAVISVNSQQQITLFNHGAETIFGYRADEVLGKSLEILLPDRFITAHRSHVNGFAQTPDHARRMAERSEIFARRKDGSEFPAEASISKLTLEAETVFTVILRDISDRKQAEWALQHKIRQEKAQNQVIQAIRNSLDLDQIFATAVQEIGQILQISAVLVYQYRPHHSDWFPLAEYHQDQSSPSYLGLSIPDQDNPITARLKRLETVRLDNTNELSDPVNQRIAQQLPQAWLLLPLANLAAMGNPEQPAIWGCLSLLRSPQWGSWQDWEADLVSTLADQLAIAIQQATLYEQICNELAERRRAEANLKRTQAAMQRLNQELEQRVQERTQQLRLALAAARMGAWEINLQDQTAVWSPENYYLLGFDNYGVSSKDSDPVHLTQPTKQLFLNCIHPDDRARVIKAENEALHNHQLYEAEFRVIWPDGTVHWLYDRGACVYDAQKQPSKLTGVSLDITDRKQAEEAIRQQVERERLLRIVTQCVHASIELDEVFPIALAETRQTFQADRVAIYRFAPDWGGQFIAESVDDGWLPVVNGPLATWNDTFLQETCGGRYAQGETFAVNDIDVAGHALCHIDILRQFQVRAYAVTPIFVQDQLWGLLAVYHNIAPHRWQDWELNLLQQISLQMAIAIQQADLFQQVQDNLAVKNLMVEIVEVINRSVHLDAVLETCLEKILQFLQCDRVIVYRLLSAGQGVVEHERVSRPELSLYGEVFEDQCLTEEYLERFKNGYITVLDNRETNPNLMPCYVDFLRQIRVLANLAVPIIQAGQLWGLLLVHQCDAPRSWQPSEIELLNRVGLEIGIASQKAELYTRLETELRQKEVLIKEVHHRVKNNLQVISSLLSLQAAAIDNPAVLQPFIESQQRISVMGMIHERLYRSANLASLHFSSYIQDLLEEVFQSYMPGHLTVHWDVAIADIELNLDLAIPFGLIINELVSNAIKYAFPRQNFCAEHRQNVISIRFEEQQEQWLLVVQDNGVGISDDVDIWHTDSLGMQVVCSLTRQLDGTLTLNREGGTKFTFVFAKPTNS